MDILSLKPGHDGQVAFLESGKLAFSIEAEKDNWPRYASISPATLLKSFVRTGRFPDVVALSGWTKEYSGRGAPIGAGYAGHCEANVTSELANCLGRSTQYFSSSHERAHIMCAYGMSPFEQGEPCYVLVWESEFGSFYFVDEQARIHKLGEAMLGPGVKYSALYALADPTYRDRFRLEDAGKLMALAGYGAKGQPTDAERRTIDMILQQDMSVASFSKATLRASDYYDIGLRDPRFHDLAKRFSDEVFGVFEGFARSLGLDPGHPLLISGGCGLNCDWNAAWAESALFRDVFVPPCCNDSGAAIGTAVDAQLHFTGDAKVEWSVYAGEEFVFDTGTPEGFEVETADLSKVATLLASGAILGWAQGRYEIGPRALGNRSILAAPFSKETRDALNRIKEREEFRPIAPVCLEEDFQLHFEGRSPSPHMLYFHKVRNQDLAAVTHVDGSARAQTVSRKDNPLLHGLLEEFRRLRGVGVLCNTSLNFKGAGFINRLSDLAKYAAAVGLDGFVVEDKLYRPVGR